MTTSTGAVTPEEWIKTSDKKPSIGEQVEISEDGINSDGTSVYLERRTCMLAGYAGGYGYFGEGFATDGENGCDCGLIIDTPAYWKPID